MQFTTLRRIAGGLRLPLAFAATALLASASVAQAQAGNQLSPELQSVRAGLDKYQDPMVAVRDGYLSTIACIDFPKPFSEGSMQVAAGAMGVHLLNMNNVGPTLDPTKPQVLIYEPKGDKLVLVAAEWFMPAQLAGSTPPTVFGQQLQGPMEGHPPIMPPEVHHYDLHVWLWRNNPAGVFSPTNAAVSCPKGGYTFAAEGATMVHTH